MANHAGGSAAAAADPDKPHHRSGGSKAIDRAAWDDASREPLLHTTRRGTLKFRWASADGKWGDTEVKDVTRIEIAQ